MKFAFDGEIAQLDGKIKWSVIYFPHSAAEHFGTNGKIPVRITADGHEYEHTLLPSKNGHYFVYNEFIKRDVGKKLGDIVSVTLEYDSKKREVIIPDYIEKCLTEANVIEAFLEQPDYLKREQINHVQIAKKDETKINRLNGLVNKLIGNNQK